MKLTAIVFGSALALATAAPLTAAEHGKAEHGKKECSHEKKMSAAEKIKKLDSDGDGKVSLEEYRAAKEAKIEKKFKKVDADGDGSFNEEELSAAMEKHHRSHEKDKGEKKSEGE